MKANNDGKHDDKKIADRKVGPGRFSVPNLISVARILASPGLIALALWGRAPWVLALYLILAASDWLDGKLAIWWRQRTTLGARLDSVGDVAMYGCLLVSCVILKGNELLGEAWWIVAALGWYGLSCLVSGLKFGRWPTYHTYTAKLSWFLMMLATAALLLDWSPWPLRITLLMVAIANLEATLITLLSRQWRVDVPSVFHATRAAKG